MTTSPSDRPLLLGMALNKVEGPPLMPSETGAGTGAGDRLLKLSGMTREEFLLGFRRRNLLANGKWMRNQARFEGHNLRKFLRGRVIVLGKDVWYALWLPPTEFFEGIVTDKAEFVLIPHPSGKNLLYNDPANREKARRILRGLE